MGGGQGAKVLIVEDEYLVALELEDIVTEAGYDVIGIMPDRESVLRLEHAPQVALVDLNLRDGPSGPSIAQLLAERYGTVIVYVTANPAQIGAPAPTAIGIVQKPFSHHAIVAAIACAVSGKPIELAAEHDRYTHWFADRRPGVVPMRAPRPVLRA
jgi:DNA-binding NarL/FixJ family response regulator